jgi:uncharacterized membrane protein
MDIAAMQVPAALCLVHVSSQTARRVGWGIYKSEATGEMPLKPWYGCLQTAQVQLGPEADDFTARFNVNEANVDIPAADAPFAFDGMAEVRDFLERCLQGSDDRTWVFVFELA